MLDHGNQVGAATHVYLIIKVCSSSGGYKYYKSTAKLQPW